jgi:hypothetical protein
MDDMKPSLRFATVILLPVLLAALAAGAQGRSGTDLDAAAKARLGLTYGPFMGLRCSHPVPKTACERIGIDIELRRPANAVVAIAGDKRIHLRTPGEHGGARRRDWVGTFTDAGIAPGSHERGTNVTRVRVELRIRFADGRRARAYFPHVLLAPGWG